MPEEVVAEDHGLAVATERGISARSPHWGTLEHIVRKLRGDRCEISGRGPTQVHHGYPFHDCVLAGRPELELTLENLHLLYSGENHAEQGHHLIVGHLRNFRSYNPDLAGCIARWKGKDVQQIQALPEWQMMAHGKPRSYSELPPKDQAKFRRLLSRVFPPDKITVFDGRVFRRNGHIVTPTK